MFSRVIWQHRSFVESLLGHLFLLGFLGYLLFAGQQWWRDSALAGLGLAKNPYTHGWSGPKTPHPAAIGKLLLGSQDGTLRVLILKRPQSMAQLVRAEKRIMQQYAQHRQLQLAWIEVEKPAQLVSHLLEGRADVMIAAQELVPADQQEGIRFTVPWGISRQQVVMRADSGKMERLGDLVTRQVAVKRSSPAFPVLEALAADHPSMDIDIIPEYVDVDTILQRVKSGQYDLTVMDSMVLGSFLPQYLDLKATFYLTEENTMAWGVPADAGELLVSLNRFLNEKYLHSNVAEIYREDLPGLQARRRLRLITYKSPVNYFFDHGNLKGFEYELIKRFAEQERMRLDVVIADSHGEMRKLLAEGKGDLIAASLPAGSYGPQSGIHYSKPYSYAAPIIVGRSQEKPLLDMGDLQGRRVILPQESPYRKTLERIKARGIEFEIIAAPAHMNMEATLFRISQGIYDLTVIGGHQLKSEFARQLNLTAYFPLEEPLPHTWVVRAADTQLLSSLNDFIAREFRRGFYNVLYARYIDGAASQLGSPRLFTKLERLSPYDEVVHRYAEQYGFDWRLIIAQMYQESRFNPEAMSVAGAEGLMQILPSTAAELGMTDLNDPDVSIHAGIRYLAYLRDSFEDNLLMEDRTWFTLAAYNAGYRRVQQARQLAARMGLREDRWFDNVEKAMLAMARPYMREGKVTRLCRCGQTAVYVREIKTLYSNYARLTRSIKMAANRVETVKDS